MFSYQDIVINTSIDKLKEVTMTYQKRIEKLKNITFTKPDKVLSLYLNTDRRDQDQQNGEWKIALKNGFNKLEEYLNASSQEELNRLRSIREKAEKYIDSLGRELPRGIILFASYDSGVWETFELQVPVETKFYWEEQPVLDQLTKLHENYPSTGFVLMQQNQIKILTSSFGKLEDTETLEFDLAIDDWRRHDGPSHVNASMGSSAVKSATQVDHFDDRMKENQHRWIKSLGSIIDKKMADCNWEKVILVGEKEEAELLDQNMNKKVDNIIQKNLFNENEHKVIEKLSA